MFSDYVYIKTIKFFNSKKVRTCMYLLYSKWKKSQNNYLGNWIPIVFKHKIYYWKFCVDVFTNGSTPGTYLRKVSCFPLRECCTLGILEQKGFGLEFIYLKWVLNMVLLGKDWKMLLENMSEQLKVGNLISTN